MKGGNEIANPTTQRKKKKNRKESTTTLKPRPLHVHQQQLQDLFRKKKKETPIYFALLERKRGA
jgi:Holliday junction resolvase RusA-like endonuclease